MAQHHAACAVVLSSQLHVCIVSGIDGTPTTQRSSPTTRLSWSGTCTEVDRALLSLYHRAVLGTQVIYERIGQSAFQRSQCTIQSTDPLACVCPLVTKCRRPHCWRRRFPRLQEWRRESCYSSQPGWRHATTTELLGAEQTKATLHYLASLLHYMLAQ